MQRVCLHAVCLAEPDADSEAWDAVSAVSSTAVATETFVLRATRDLEIGAEVLLDVGSFQLRGPFSVQGAGGSEE